MSLLARQSSKLLRLASTRAFQKQAIQVSALSTSSARLDKKLFTPGPLGVNHETKTAMLRDLGSRDVEFMNTVKYIRQRVLEVAGISTDTYTMVPMQGSGTFAIEGVIQTMIPRQGGKLLIATSGSYGLRMEQIAKYLDIETTLLKFNEDKKVDVSVVEEALKADPSITHVSMVHCETSSGVVHPVEEVASMVKRVSPNAVFFVDAMSSFGGVPLEVSNIDFLVTSANKCLEGVPGFGVVIARKDKLMECKGNSRSLSLDVYEQYLGLESNGQFRFTPPTHTILGFKKAVECWEQEGGVEGRSNRYQENRRILREGMAKMGFKEFLSSDHTGYIITSFFFPRNPNFDFVKFYTRLSDMNMVIYPGKVTEADSFRIGNIGDLHAKDMTELLVCIETVCQEMGLSLPLQ